MNYTGLHGNAPDNHRPERWVFTDAADRAALAEHPAPTADDVGKWAYQQSDGSYWRLTDDNPVAWQRVAGNTAGGATADRPTAPALYHCYIDTTLGRPVWWSGTAWRD